MGTLKLVGGPGSGGDVDKFVGGELDGRGGNGKLSEEDEVRWWRI